MQMQAAARHYGALRIRICKGCNTDMKVLETTLARAFDAQDPEALLAVEPWIWGAWASKAMFGLASIEARRHGFGPDSSDAEAGDLIFVRDLLGELRDLFRGFFDGVVASDAVALRAYRTQFDTEARDVTFFLSDENAGTLLVQVDGVAVFVSIFDSVYLDEHHDAWTDAAASLRLNPLQIYEIYCRHVAFLQARIEKRMTVPTRRGSVCAVECVGESVPAEVDLEFYRWLLEQKLLRSGSFREGEWIRPSWLLDARGRPWFIPLEATRNARSRLMASLGETRSDLPRVDPLAPP
jgi:hypothetical protein